MTFFLFNSPLVSCVVSIKPSQPCQSGWRNSSRAIQHVQTHVPTNFSAFLHCCWAKRACLRHVPSLQEAGDQLVLICTPACLSTGLRNRICGMTIQGVAQSMRSGDSRVLPVYAHHLWKYSTRMHLQHLLLIYLLPIFRPVQVDQGTLCECHGVWSSGKAGPWFGSVF